MRLRQMGFSTKIKAHQNLFTLEILRFITEYFEDRNATQAALRAGIPATYANRYGAWLKKRPLVSQALETDLDANDLRQLKKAMREIEQQMQICRKILNLEEQ